MRLRRILVYLLFTLLVVAALLGRRARRTADAPRNRVTGRELEGEWTGKSCRYYQQELRMALEMYQEGRGKTLTEIPDGLVETLMREDFLGPPSRDLYHGAELFVWDLKGTKSHPPPNVVCLRHGWSTERSRTATEALAELGIDMEAHRRRAEGEARRDAERRAAERRKNQLIELVGVLLFLISGGWILSDLKSWFRREPAPGGDEPSSPPSAP